MFGLLRSGDGNDLPEIHTTGRTVHPKLTLELEGPFMPGRRHTESRHACLACVLCLQNDSAEREPCNANPRSGQIISRNSAAVVIVDYRP